MYEDKKRNLNLIALRYQACNARFLFTQARYDERVPVCLIGSQPLQTANANRNEQNQQSCINQGAREYTWKQVVEKKLNILFMNQSIFELEVLTLHPMQTMVRQH